MLVLNRKKGESLFIGDHIEITVVELGSDQVKIGINAPREIAIYRAEIYREVREANQAAARNLSDIGSKLEAFKLDNDEG
jgi:carbon storage regulator